MLVRTDRISSEDTSTRVAFHACVWNLDAACERYCQIVTLELGTGGSYSTHLCFTCSMSMQCYRSRDKRTLLLVNSDVLPSDRLVPECHAFNRHLRGQTSLEGVRLSFAPNFSAASCNNSRRINSTNKHTNSSSQKLHAQFTNRSRHT